MTFAVVSNDAAFSETPSGYAGEPFSSPLILGRHIGLMQSFE